MVFICDDKWVQPKHINKVNNFFSSFIIYYKLGVTHREGWGTWARA
jgi:hypothetical protein